MADKKYFPDCDQTLEQADWNLASEPAISGCGLKALGNVMQNGLNDFIEFLLKGNFISEASWGDDGYWIPSFLPIRTEAEGVDKYFAVNIDEDLKRWHICFV